MTALAAPSMTIVDAAPQWRQVTQRPPGYIDVAEAVRRATSSDHYLGSRKPLTVKKWVQRLAESKRNDALAPVMYENRVFLPPSLHPALSELTALRGDNADLASLSTGRRNRAILKRAIVRDFTAFARTPEGRALGVVAARREFVRQRAASYTYIDESGKRKTQSIAERTLERWESQNRDGGLAALAEDGRGGYDRRGPSIEAVDLFKALYFDPKKPSIAKAWREVKCEARRNSWRWFAALSTCRAWLPKAIDQRTAIFHREGKDAYRAKCEPYIQPDPESFAPGECWMSDHSAANCWVRARSGRIIRPFVTIWLDWRSRTLLGLSVVPVGTAESILIAFRNAAREFGLPQTVQLDNGKDFSSYIWTGGKPKRFRHRTESDFKGRAEGIYNLLGIDAKFNLPLGPNGKAKVEAWFRHLDEFCKLFPSYCGNSPENRPDAHAALVEQAIGIDEFATKLREWATIYNSTPHSGEGMDGMTPTQVIALAPTKRVLTEAQQRELLAAWPRPVRIGRNGVSIRLAGASYSYGAFDPALQALPIGQQVRVSFDPENMAAVTVWSMDGRRICEAQENHRFNRGAPSSEELREAFRAKARAARAHRASREAGMKHLIDPYVMAVAAKAQDAADRRLPDPTHPDGGPNFIPVQTSIEVDSRQRQDLRRVVGGPDVLQDAQDRLAAFARKCELERKEKQTKATVDPLLAWARREAANA